MKKEFDSQRPYVAPQAKFIHLKERTSMLETFSLETEAPIDEYQDGGELPWDTSSN